MNNPDINTGIDRHHARTRAKSWDLWRLVVDRGRQVWRFDASAESDSVYLEEMARDFAFDKSVNPNSADRVYRYLRARKLADDVTNEPGSTDPISEGLIDRVTRSWQKGVAFYSTLQAEDGHWPGDYGGPLFLLPGLIFASYLTTTPFTKPQSALMKRYMLNHQNPDGGWGLHIEGDSTMFGTVLQYVALRILGEEPRASAMIAARQWIINHGGAKGIPSWGKFYLSLMNLYDWDGCNPLLPELWLLPKSLPVHPWRFWCHARMVFLPMSYCYGHRIRCPEDDLIHDLRKEIYIEDYGKIDWRSNMHTVASTDNFNPLSGLMKALNRLLSRYDRNHSKRWRKKGLEFALAYVDAEDQQTEYIDIGPVNQVINSICTWHAYGANSEQFTRHVVRWPDYLWLAEDGLKMNGYNGSQLWDTAFAVQAILERPEMSQEFKPTLEKAGDFISISQVVREVENGPEYFRHPSLGGWPFSTRAHGWPIADCTAEGLCATLKLQSCGMAPSAEVVGKKRLEQAVDVILSLQNKDGGWATYENYRGPKWLELLNASEVFGQIMIDYSWTECTSACIKALVTFRNYSPDYKKREIERSIDRGVQFVLSQQRPDGGWRGAWGVCFTYGANFALEALSLTGNTFNNSDAVKKGCAFLVSKQREDGGWGESYRSCVEGEYVQNENSQVVNTSWALLGLMAADYPDREPIDAGIGFLLSRQEGTGDWPQEGISGVFNQNCMITYTAYRNIFPIWALGRHLNTYT